MLVQGSESWEMSGSSPRTTISEMEILAAVKALRSIPTGSIVHLSSDSELLIRGMELYVGRWESQGWRNSRANLIQHRELWSQLLAMNEQMVLHWQWIKGHIRHPFQTRADALAYQAARVQSCIMQMAA